MKYRFGGHCRGCGMSKRPLAPSDYWGGEACKPCIDIVAEEQAVMDELNRRTWT